MRKFLGLILAFISTLAFSSAMSAPLPNESHPTTFLGPMLKGSYTDNFNGTTAYSVLGEAGVRNFRIGGTVGWAIQDNQRFKVSGEYLWQKITYPFFVGNTSQWVNQGALGAAYQYDLSSMPYVPQFNLSAFYSHAPSHSLATETGTFVNRDGFVQSFVDMRRIAGSNAGGIAPGISFHPWLGGEAGIDLNYDKVRYDTRWSTHHDAIGFGGTARFNQALPNSINLGLLAAVRQPFNNYQADIGWAGIPNAPGLILDVMGAYTAGKNTLPSTWNVGISADYLIGGMSPPSPALMRQVGTNIIQQVPNNQLTRWVSSPAIYLPQVLAIPDEAVSFPVSNVCDAVVVTGILPDLIDVTIPTFVGAATVFAGTAPLTFSVSFTSSTATASTVTIEPVSGVVTITPVLGVPVILTITVTATNACGSASTTFEASIPGD